MARYKYQGTFRDKFGHIVSSGTIAVFLKGTDTPASIYTAEAGGVAVNSVISSTDGSFYFYVDDGDYANTQHFKLTLSGTSIVSKEYDDIVVINYIVSSTDITKLAIANNLSDLDDAPTAIINLGAVPSTRTVAGHPLSADATISKTDVGLGNVTNEAQARKGATGRSDLSLGTAAQADIPILPAYGGLGSNIYDGYTSLPASSSGNIGKIYRKTNGIRGLWMDQGTQLFGLNGEIVNVKEAGVKSGVDCTTALATIVTATNAISGLNKPTLYFPYGTYYVQPAIIPDIKSNVYAPDASIQSIVGDTSTSYVLSVDYSTTIGQFFIVRALHGSDYGGSTPYNCGLQVNGADNSYFNIRQLELLDTCISLSGALSNYHIAQNRFDIGTMMSFNKAINLTAGVNVQNETNTFRVEYMQFGVANSIGVYMNNATGTNTYVTNNHFIINTMEHPTTGTVAFRLTGTTPAKITQNVFEVICNLSSPSGGGKIIYADANIGKNRFSLTNCDFSLYDTVDTQIFNQGPVDWTYGRSEVFGSATPAGGAYWTQGDKWWQVGASAGGSPGGICITSGAGAAAVWKAMAALAA